MMVVCKTMMAEDQCLIHTWCGFLGITVHGYKLYIFISCKGNHKRCKLKGTEIPEESSLSVSSVSKASEADSEEGIKV